jgi:pyruvate/2-oxoglutarate dehydrogenase complex dihydrolipoamide acyltransferase (E2) component
MARQKSAYTVAPFPLSRRLVIDSARIGARRHTIHGLVEVDVTEARRRLHQQNAQTGEAFSFTAFILACLGCAVDANPHVQACRNWRGQLILFDDVDAAIIIEINLENKKFPLAYVIRSINQKSVEEIHREIRAVQANAIHTQRERQLSLFRWFLLLPGLIRDMVYRLISSNPFWWKRMVGTVALSSVGMFGSGGGWGIGMTPYTLGLTLGGIGTQATLIDGRIENREKLCVTISVDHDIVDGAPAARFVQSFRELVESAHGLPV